MKFIQPPRTLLYLCVFLLLLGACKKKSLNFEGKIVSTSNHAFIKDATVTIGDKKITTNEKGEYNISGLKINTDYIFTIVHADYVTITRRIKFYTNKKASSNFTLIPREKAQLINSTDTTTATFNPDGKVIIYPNSFITQSGANYKGKVSLRTTFINPKDDRMIAGSPATFMSSDNQALQSYGMLDIYPTTPEGERLEITERTPIKVSLPNISGIKNDVGLYSVNANSGLWNKKGTLTYNEETSTLQGQITSTISPWNANSPCASGTVCVKIHVKDHNGNPMVNRSVTLKGVSYSGFSGPFYTDASGFVFLQVCQGQVFKLLDDIILCCIPPNPPAAICCADGGWIAFGTIDMSTVTLTSPCTYLGSFTYY